MSRVSQISKQYHAVLSASHDEYEALYRDRVESTRDFYQKFFHKLVIDFGSRFKQERVRARLQERIEKATGTNTLQFIAIDGTCRREPFADLITVFGAAYGARGELVLSGSRHLLRYKRWSLDHDVSMVAWVPIPFARLEEVTPGQSEQFLVTEEERVNLASVHVQVMQLAEVFLAYNTIRSSRIDAPHVLMMDLSPSSVLASVAHTQEKLGLRGYPFDRRSLTQADITIALSHPFSSDFGIPSPKQMDLYRVLVAELARAPEQSIDVSAIAKRHGVTEAQLLKEADGLVKRGVLQRSGTGAPTLDPAVHPAQSWAYTAEFFQNICTRLFLDKDPRALQYDAPDEHGVVRRRWMRRRTSCAC
jgi:hypothetical protein